ncbi:dethiobiotin synthetase [Nocardia sp. NPDC004151]|uniref:SLOG cluster 4 domain-containing protein n=1 Tax=Nocardia sp. NPDC004151 TaxID=3364304 RepID=UPI00369432C5
MAVSPIQVAVCGPRDATDADTTHAREIGRLLAEAGATVLCGGGTGVMAAVAEGASAAGGLVIAVRPDTDPAGVCAGVSAVLYTNLGAARNAVLVGSADAVIVAGGSWGTLSEYALANGRGVPVVMIGGWQVLDAAGEPIEGGAVATTPAETVDLALTAATEFRRRLTGAL